MSLVLVTIDGFWSGWLDLLTHSHSDLADLQNLRFTITHVLGFAAFTSRILAMDLYYCHFKPHIKSSFHSLIHFLPFNFRLPSPELDQILENNSFKRTSFSLCNISARTTQKTHPLYCWEGLFTVPLFANGRPIMRVGFRGNGFTESLPSNGYTSHKIFGSHGYDIGTYFHFNRNYLKIMLLEMFQWYRFHQGKNI
jgi:hypothetical protein